MDHKLTCFVIMPITDPEGYLAGHFKHVFEDIFAPACDKAGYFPVRADQVRQTNLIHLDILQKLIESPMALCDLSSRNPNVLFELGLRQAFDKPVVLVREMGTQDIFDIGPLRFTEYHRERIYHEVLEDQEKIAAAITATHDAFEKGEGINSIVRLLSLTQPASLVEVQEADKDPVLQIIRAELSELRSEFKAALRALDTQSALHREGAVDIGDLIESYSVDIAMRQMKNLRSRLDEINRQIIDQELIGDLSSEILDSIKDAKGILSVMVKAVGKKNSHVTKNILALIEEYDIAELDYQDVVDRIKRREKG